MDRFIELLRQAFEDEMTRKTGWGRIEVMTAFDKACVKALAKYAKEKNIILD